MYISGLGLDQFKKYDPKVSPQAIKRKILEFFITKSSLQTMILMCSRLNDAQKWPPSAICLLLPLKPFKLCNDFDLNPSSPPNDPRPELCITLFLILHSETHLI